MVKLLRKYNKYILVVGGSLLMVAFLVPQAFNSLLGDPSRMVYAKLGDEKITLGEHDLAGRQFSALEEFATGLVKGEFQCQNAEHWMLLVREARAGGLIGEAGDGTGWTELNSAMENMFAANYAQSKYGPEAQQKLTDTTIRDECVAAGRQLLARQRLEVAAKHRLTPQEFDTVLADARGVFRLKGAFYDAARFSDRRADTVKAERFEGAVTETLRIPAERIAFAMPEPSEDEIRAQFEKYRDVEPGSGEFGFGYRLRARVKLEWLAIDRAAIEKAVPNDAVEANKRWRNDRKKYPGEFLAEQARVEADIKKERVDKIAAEMDMIVRGEFKRAAARLEADGPYRKLPPDWASRRPRLEDVAQSAVKTVKENTGLDIPLPTVTVEASKWLTEPEVYSLPGIASAQVSLGGGQAAPLGSLIFTAKEFNRTDLGESRVPLQVGLTSGELAGVDRGTRYYFTILDFRPDSPPDSLDEVRPRVVEDLKQLAAYERLKSSLPSFEAMAGIAGIGEIKKTIDAEYPLPKQPEAKPGEIPTGPDELEVNPRQFVPKYIAPTQQASDSPELREEVLAIAARVDPTKPIGDMPVSERIASAAMPSRLSVQVSVVVGIQPPTVEVLRAMGEQRLLTLKRELMNALIQSEPALDPFSFESLKARWKFKIEDLSDSKPMHMPTPKRS